MDLRWLARNTNPYALYEAYNKLLNQNGEPSNSNHGNALKVFRVFASHSEICVPWIGGNYDHLVRALSVHRGLLDFIAVSENLKDGKGLTAYDV